MENVEVDPAVVQILGSGHGAGQGSPSERMTVNPACFDDELIKQITESFQNRQALSTDAACVLSKAYPLAVFKNFLKEDFAKELKEAVLEFPFKHKATDLFDMNQSPDLKPFAGDGCDNPISKLSDAIFSPAFAGTIGKIIGKPLGTQIDLAAQRYDRGQYLLCHDDRLESRRVAFVLYLVDPEWDAELDGGQFEKYPLDFTGAALPDPVESYTPAWNTLVFFEVSMWSHHQVSEVLGMKPRLSVAGWLHDAEKEAVPMAPLSEPSLSPLALEISLPIIKEDKIRTTSSQFTRIITSDDDTMLLKLIKPETLALPSSLDYPTWPVIIRLGTHDYFNESLQKADDKRLYCVHVIDGEAEVNGTVVPSGNVLIHHEPQHRISAIKDCVTLIYWSYLVE